MPPFTKNISQVAGVSPAAAKEHTPGNLFQGLGTVLGGISDAVEANQAKKNEEEENAIALELNQRQFENVLGSEPPAEESDQQPFVDVEADADRDAALQNSSVRSADKEIQRIGQAISQTRDPVKSEQLFANAANIAKDIANKHPQHAKFVFAQAKSIFGFEPLEKIVGLREAEDQFNTQLEEQRKTDLIDVARDTGVDYLNADGSIDRERMIRAGVDANRRAEILRLKDEEAARATVSEATRTRKVSENIIEAYTPSFMDTVVSVGENIINADTSLLSDPKALQQSNETWVKTKTKWRTGVIKSLAEQGITSQSGIDKATEHFDGFIKMVDSYFEGPQSFLQLSMNSLKQYETNAGITLAESMPTHFFMQQSGGRELSATLMSQQIKNNPKAQLALTSEADALLNGGLTNKQNDANHVAFYGGKKPLNMFTPEEAQPLIRTHASFIKKLVKDPAAASPEAINAFGTKSVQTAALALKSEDPKQLAAASQTLSGPGFRALFSRFAADPNNADIVPVLADNIRLLNMKAMTRNMLLVAPTKTSGDLSQLGIRETERTETVPQYNPATGLFEAAVVSGAAIDAFGNPLPIFPDSATRKRMDTANRALENIIELRKFGFGRFSELTDNQMREFSVVSSGVPFKEGSVKEELPAWLFTGQVPTKPTAPQDAPQSPQESQRQSQVGEGRVFLDPNAEANLGPPAELATALGASAPTDRAGVQALATQVAEAEGVDVALVLSILQQESGANHDNPGEVPRGTSGEVGLGQLMEATANNLGVDRNDPVENVIGAVRLLKEELVRFNGDVDLAIAAYNAGSTKVRAGKIPASTKKYVQEVKSRL